MYKGHRPSLPSPKLGFATGLALHSPPHAPSVVTSEAGGVVELFNIRNHCPAPPLTARSLLGPPIFILPGRLPAARASTIPEEGSSTSLRGGTSSYRGGSGERQSLYRHVCVCVLLHM